MKIVLSLVLAASLSFTSFAVVKSDKMSNLKKQQESVAANKNKYKKKKSEAKKYLASVDKQLSSVATQIYENQKKLDKTQTDIKKTKKKLNKAKKSVIAQNKDMEKRIQFMYENGDTEMLDMLLNSKSISDFLNKAEYITELSSYDRKMFNKLKDTQDKIAKSKKALSDEKDNLLALQDKQKAEQASLKNLEASKKKELSGYDDLIKHTEASEKRIANEIAAQQAAIAQAEQAEQQYNNTASSSVKYKGSKGTKGGGWTWPCPSSHTITSEYGYRGDPFGGSGGGFHSGLDIGAPAGTPIVAAKAGTVAWSSFSSTAGNWIGISHGNGVVSVYMHMSARIAKAGQHVNKGQTIGLVGTTGSSTGNHLHFGVQVNGSYVNPHNYIG
ncbi:MAG: peptidoglycan DD-metalloendopeptidase family protein [Eubacterium sp.]|nr:peptidoglycan DD-metalloendopeptidase family protein [Eubacterium sp.]